MLNHSHNYNLSRGKLIRIIIVLNVIIGFSGRLLAQEKDFGLWTTVNLEKKFSKKFSGTLTQEFRFNENVSQLDNAFTNLSADYNFSKALSASFNYRFINKRLVDGYYQVRQRVYLDVAYKYKHKDFAVTLRTRIQDQMIDALNPEKKYPSSWYWRNKLLFKYNLKEFDPYIYTEIFCPLNGPDAMIINNVRLAAGCDYSITKKHTLNFYYLINKEVNVSNPVTTFITGIEYTYSF